MIFSEYIELLGLPTQAKALDDFAIEERARTAVDKSLVDGGE